MIGLQWSGVPEDSRARRAGAAKQGGPAERHLREDVPRWVMGKCAMIMVVVESGGCPPLGGWEMTPRRWRRRGRERSDWLDAGEVATGAGRNGKSCEAAASRRADSCGSPLRKGL
jgi:hypothetical protein